MESESKVNQTINLLTSNTSFIDFLEIKLKTKPLKFDFVTRTQSHKKISE